MTHTEQEQEYPLIDAPIHRLPRQHGAHALRSCPFTAELRTRFGDRLVDAHIAQSLTPAEQYDEIAARVDEGLELEAEVDHTFDFLYDTDD